MKIKLPLCQVQSKSGIHIDFLYLENERVVVLLNNIPDNAYLDPFKQIRDKHIIPEAHIMIIPREIIDNILMIE
jgi:hypothetical protein